MAEANRAAEPVLPPLDSQEPEAPMYVHAPSKERGECRRGEASDKAAAVFCPHCKLPCCTVCDETLHAERARAVYKRREEAEAVCEQEQRLVSLSAKSCVLCVETCGKSLPTVRVQTACEPKQCPLKYVGGAAKRRLPAEDARACASQCACTCAGQCAGLAGMDIRGAQQEIAVLRQQLQDQMSTVAILREQVQIKTSAVTVLEQQLQGFRDILTAIQKRQAKSQAYTDAVSLDPTTLERALLGDPLACQINVLDANEKCVELSVRKELTIAELTKLAHKELGMEERGISLNCVRLRRFRSGRVPGDTFNGQKGKTLTELSLVWGTVNLMLETCGPDGAFEEYDPNGIMPDVHVLVLPSETPTKIPIVIGDSRTIGNLKDLVQRKLGLALPRNRVFVYKASFTGQAVAAILNDDSSLYNASIYSQTKVGVCVMPTDVNIAEFQIRAVLLEAFNSVTIQLASYGHPTEDGQPITTDQRQTFRNFKKRVLAPLIGLEPSEFKVYKAPAYHDAKPVELSMPEEALTLSDILLGSNKLLYHKDLAAAGDGLTAVLETYLCDFRSSPNEPVLQPLGEMRFTAKCTTGQAKTEFVANLNRLKKTDPIEYGHIEVHPRRLRLRDINAYGDSPTCGYYGEQSPLLLQLVRRMCFEVLQTPEPEIMENFSPLFLRQWHPDTNMWGPLQEILVPHTKYCMDGFYEAFTAFSGIPRAYASFGRGPTLFPFEKTVFDSENVTWQGELTRMSDIAHGQIDGTCLLYKDRRTEAVPLTALERTRLAKEVALAKRKARAWNG